jgi:hypothetical protein
MPGEKMATPNITYGSLLSSTHMAGDKRPKKKKRKRLHVAAATQQAFKKGR